jgi:hypothetical protein
MKPQPIGGGTDQLKVAIACHHRNLEFCPHYCIYVSNINIF